MVNKKELLNLSTDEILLLIGKEMMQDKLYANTSDDSNIIQKAKLWFSYKREDFEKVICKNEIVINLISSSDNNRRFLLLTAIADALTPLLLPVSPWTVSALIIQEGIYSFCPNLNKINNES